MAESGHGLDHKLIAHLYQNPDFYHHLRLAVLLRLRSLGRDIPPDRPIIARVFFGIEPEDVQDFWRIRAGADGGQRKRYPVGILQVLSVTIPKGIPPYMAEQVPRLEQVRSSWGSDDPIALLELVFCSVSGPRVYVTERMLSIPLPYHLIADVERFSIPIISDDDDSEEYVQKPATWETCLE